MKTRKKFSEKNILNRKVRPVLFLMLLLSFIFITSCEDDSVDTVPDTTDTTDPNELTLAEVINRGDESLLLDAASITYKKENVGDPVEVTEDYETTKDGSVVTERSVCTKQKVSLFDAKGTFQLLNANANVVYPGALLQGNSLNEATPLPIVVKRAGGTISYNVINGNLNSSVTVDEVKKSTITDAMNTIIAGANELGFPDNLIMDVIDIESQDQLAVEIGISVETFSTKTEGKLNFSTDKTYNRKLVKLSQVFYTMSYDLPNSLDEVFHPSVTADQLSKYVQEDNPATFISSVNYGRIFYMLIESTSSKTEMDLKLKGEYNTGLTTIEAQGRVNAISTLKSTNIKVIAYGGDGSEGMAGLKTTSDIVTRLGQTKNIALGLPLSYEVRSVDNPSIVVGVKLATEYDEVTCAVKGVLAPDSYKELVDIFEDGIGAASQLWDDHIILFNKAGDKYTFYDVAAGKKGSLLYNINALPFKFPASFGTIGAAALISPNVIRFFDKTGTNFIDANSVASSWKSDIEQSPIPFPNIPKNWNLSSKLTASQQTSTWYSTYTRPENGNPFAGGGFVAAVEFSDRRVAMPGYEFFGPQDRYTQYYFANNGSNVAYYKHYPEYFTVFPTGSNSWDSSETTNSFLSGTGLQTFNKVGAAVRVTYSSTTANQLYFSDEGDQMIIRGNPTFEGPYVIN